MYTFWSFLISTLYKVSEIFNISIASQFILHVLFVVWLRNKLSFRLLIMFELVPWTYQYSAMRIMFVALETNGIFWWRFELCPTCIHRLGIHVGLANQCVKSPLNCQLTLNVQLVLSAQFYCFLGYMPSKKLYMLSNECSEPLIGHTNLRKHVSTNKWNIT